MSDVSPEFTQAVARANEPEVDPARRKFVSQWAARVKAAKKHHEPAFKQMREDMALALRGAGKDWPEDSYVVPIVMRHVNQAVAVLYAKNPQPQAKRRARLLYQLWDGKPQSLEAAVLTVSQDHQMGVVTDPQAHALLAEVATAQENNRLYDRMARTLEYMVGYFLNEQEPSFKASAKQAVRRAKVTGIAYFKLGYQRILEKRPEVTSQIAQAADQLATLQRMRAELAEGEMEPDSADLEELRTLIASLEGQESVVAREGPVIDFPRGTELIVDPRCRQIKGFVGAKWVAQEYLMTPDEVREAYNVDLESHFTPYTSNEDGLEAARPLESDEADGAREPRGQVMVWEVWHKGNGQVFTIADGYPGYLRAPEAPRPALERFWPFFTLTFNDIEHESRIYPPSDVEILKDPQLEYNRSRQGLREHREQNRPYYVAVKGRLEDDDKARLANHASGEIVELNALNQGESVESLLQRGVHEPIDPALYETNSVMEDVLRSVGSQEANLGGTSGATATETSIAEGSRIASIASQSDELDELLSALAKSMAQMMLLEMSADYVRRVAGPGAVWPEFSRQEAAEELFVTMRAGSTGRPNKAAELADLERVTPLLLQIPGVNPISLAKRVVEVSELGSLDDLILEGAPSITALNAMAGRQVQPGTGDSATDPAQQGGEGGRNAARPADRQTGPQPSFPGAGGATPVGA